MSTAYSASLRCVQCIVTLHFVGPWKSRYSMVVRNSSNLRFYNAFGVCSIFCTFWASSMRSKICPLWSSEKLTFPTKNKVSHKWYTPQTCRICYTHREHYKPYSLNCLGELLIIYSSNDLQCRNLAMHCKVSRVQNIPQTPKANAHDLRRFRFVLCVHNRTTVGHRKPVFKNFSEHLLSSV